MIIFVFMKTLKTLALLLALVLPSVSARAQDSLLTFAFAQRDTCTLYLDVHQPSPGAELTFEGAPKPTILFAFGGGFITGSRNNSDYDEWFKILNDNGYRVVSIDYRLGLKGQQMAFDLFHILDSAKKTKHAVDVGVEDVLTPSASLARMPGSWASTWTGSSSQAVRPAR